MLSPLIFLHDPLPRTLRVNADSIPLFHAASRQGRTIGREEFGNKSIIQRLGLHGVLPRSGGGRRMSHENRRDDHG
jgi:hypothetical protein